MYNFFNVGVPLVTAGAFTDPFCRRCAAILAEEGDFGF